VERIHDLCKRIALRRIPLRSALVDLRIEGIQIQPDVDSGIRKRLHARIVVGLGVDMVHADRVGANRLHERGVGRTLRRCHERVIGDELVCDACVDQLAVKYNHSNAFSELRIPLT
jgi:hypothetical protein